jgi:parallel beta-helix repeat protein
MKADAIIVPSPSGGDDSAMLDELIASANNGERPIYFPVGIWRASNLNRAAARVVIEGEPGAWITSVDNPNPGRLTQVLTLGSGSRVSTIGIDGNIAGHAQPMSFVAGIWVRGGDVRLDHVVVRNCSSQGIAAQNVEDLAIQAGEIDNTSHNSIWVNGCPRTKVLGCTIGRCGFSNIFILNSPASLIYDNVIGPSGPVGAGIYPQGSRNLIIRANVIRRTRGGIEAWTPFADSPEHARALMEQASRMVIDGNDVSENYNGGISVSSNGAVIRGNRIAKNGHGGINSDTLVEEPGIKLDTRYPGSGYQQGDILTLVGGEGEPARVMVCMVWGGGRLFNTVGTDVAIYPVSMGDYEVPPRNPVEVTGGHGAGARMIYTNEGAPGMRYSQNYKWTFGLATVGPMRGALIDKNKIRRNLGAGIVFHEIGPNFLGKASETRIRENVIRRNQFSVKGKTGNKPFDDVWPASNIFTANKGYP